MKNYRIGLGLLLSTIFAAGAPAPLMSGQAGSARIGVFTPGATLESVREGMQEGLVQLGYSEGKNVAFIVEDTKGSAADLGARMARLLSAKPDVIFTVSTDHAKAAKAATSTVPIVFAWVGDPVQVGLIDSYPYSKTNLTGVTAIGDALSGKRLELLLEMAPKVRRLLVTVSARETVSTSSFRALEPAAQKLGVRLMRRDVSGKQEIAPALEKVPRGSVDGIFNLPSTLIRANTDLFARKAKMERIPLAVPEESLLEHGALFSYGPNPRPIGRQAARLIVKILAGTKPGEIIVQTPEKYFLAINQIAAKEVGLIIPKSILEQVDRLVTNGL